MTFLISSFACLLMDEILGNFIPMVANHQDSSVSSPMLLRTGIATILWCTYMVKSRRVKATFVK
jgi:hypothetical protein